MVVVSQYPKPLITLLLTTANLNIARWEVTKPTSHSWTETFKISLAAPKVTPKTSQSACHRKEANSITANSYIEVVPLLISITMAPSRYRIKTTLRAFPRLLEISTWETTMAGWCTSLITSLAYSSKLATTYSAESTRLYETFFAYFPNNHKTWRFTCPLIESIRYNNIIKQHHIYIIYWA